MAKVLRANRVPQANKVLLVPQAALVAMKAPQESLAPQGMKARPDPMGQLALTVRRVLMVPLVLMDRQDGKAQRGPTVRRVLMARPVMKVPLAMKVQRGPTVMRALPARMAQQELKVPLAMKVQLGQKVRLARTVHPVCRVLLGSPVKMDAA